MAIPYFAWQYRRWGAVDPSRVWAQGSFVLYLMCAWALVLMPFPDQTCARDVSPQVEPFNWLRLAQTQSADRYALLTNPNVVMFVFNIALLFPLGVYLRRWFGRGLLFSGVAGFSLSLAFELTQYSAIFGLYECPYRQFNVDDLMANTAGALIGWLLAPLIIVVPRRGGPVRPDRAVTLPRRTLSLVIDYLLAALIALAWSSLAETYGLPQARSEMMWALLIVAWLVPLITGGRTPGQFAVGARMESTNGSHRNPLRLFVRWVMVWGPYPAALAFLRAAGVSTATADLIAAVILALWLVLLTTGVHEAVSRTRTVVDQADSRNADTSVGSVGNT